MKAVFRPQRGCSCKLVDVSISLQMVKNNSYNLLIRTERRCIVRQNGFSGCFYLFAASLSATSW